MSSHFGRSKRMPNQSNCYTTPGPDQYNPPIPYKHNPPAYTLGKYRKSDNSSKSVEPGKKNKTIIYKNSKVLDHINR